jgi:hypothetical protein
MNFDDGLKATIEWFRRNWEQIRRDAEFPPGMSSATRGVVAFRQQESPVELAIR